jgi:anaerobic ribonucleoside-triphosphate reductase activating protein
VTPIRLNKLHTPVTALGYGRRLGIWTQGCTIGCAGCVSRDTWDSYAGRAMPVSELVNWIASNARDDIDGITVSGGEPFDQPVALSALIDGIRTLSHQGQALDLLVYSGRSLEWLQRHHARIVDSVDALITGPYMRHRPAGRAWIGSANQLLHTVTTLGRERYADGLPPLRDRTMQFSVDAQSVWMVGVPAPGDLDRIETALAKSGIALGGVSWRA